MEEVYVFEVTVPMATAPVDGFVPIVRNCVWDTKLAVERSAQFGYRFRSHDPICEMVHIPLHRMVPFHPDYTDVFVLQG